MHSILLNIGTQIPTCFLQVVFYKKADDARKWDQVDMKTHFLDIPGVFKVIIWEWRSEVSQLVQDTIECVFFALYVFKTHTPIFNQKLMALTPLS